MRKKFLILMTFLFAALLLFCACDSQPPKTATSISTKFTIEGMREAKRITITAKEKSSGMQTKINIGEDETLMEMEPGVYVITRVLTNDSRISLTLKEQYFTINKSHKIIPLTVAEEYKKSGIEWFFYNNSLYLLSLVGCAIFLGIYKYKKEKDRH